MPEKNKELFEEPSTALAVQTDGPAVSITPLGLIQSALSKNVAPEVLKELVALHQSMIRFEWEAQERQAKMDFDDALNSCQQQIGRIAPNQNRKDTNSWWADYAQLDRTIRPIYTASRFSVAFSEVAPIAPGKVRIQATLSRAGVSKEFFGEITPSTTGPKGGAMATATDADAIAQSRAKRYILLDIFNIAIGIDKDEKQGVCGDDVLSQEEYAPLMEAIEGAETALKVTGAFIRALKAAKNEVEKAAFEKAANKRKAELQCA